MVTPRSVVPPRRPISVTGEPGHVLGMTRSARHPHDVARTVQDFARKVAVVLRTDGPRALVGKVGTKIGDYVFDLRYGVDTCRQTTLSELGVPEPQRRHGVDYQPTGSSEFSRLMRDAPVPRSGIFVDVGAGKGRVALMASRLGFDRVVGVELAEELCSVARINVTRFRRRVPDAAPVDIVCGDASSYVFDDDITVVFLFNPFDEVIVEQVMTRIDESLARRQRTVHLIYNNARHTEAIEGHAFSLIGRYTYPRAVFAVYRGGSPGDDRGRAPIRALP